MNEARGPKRNADDAGLGEANEADGLRRSKRRAAATATATIKTITANTKRKRTISSSSISQPERKRHNLPNAVWAKDKALVEEILKERGKVPRSSLNNPLHVAVKLSVVDILEVLLSHGADPDYRKVLNMAVWKGNYDVVECLLKHGASPNAVCKDKNWTTVMHALFLREDTSEDDTKRIFTLLTTHGADINVKTFNGKSLIFEACARRNLDIIKRVLSCGADVNDRTTAISTYKRSYPIGVRRYCRPVYDHLKDVTPLHEVVQRVDTYRHSKPHDPASEITQYLLSKGADVTARDNQGYTPLMRCLQTQNDAEVVDLLLKAGSDLSAVGDDGQTPLTLSLMYNNRFTEALLKAGVRVSYMFKSNGNFMYTPLLYAIIYNYKENQVLEILKRTDQEYLNFEGHSLYCNTALEMAVQNSCDRSVLEEMMKRGCDPNHRNNFHVSPLSLMLRRDDVALVRTALLYGGTGACYYYEGGDCSKDPVHTAAAYGRLKQLKMVLSTGGKICPFTKKHSAPFTDEIKDFLKTHQKQIYSLQELCRISIWQCMNCVINDIEKVCLPSILKKYIKLEDFIM